MTWPIFGACLFLAIVAASWVCIVAELSLIVKELSFLSRTLDLMRAEYEVRGSDGQG